MSLETVKRAVLWLYASRRFARRWIVRVVSFYFGYKILNHQIYEAKEVDPIVMALGLWLCGIAPADIFDGLRKLGDEVSEGKVEDTTKGLKSDGGDA